MSKPKKNKEWLGPLPAIALFLGGVGLCLIRCQALGVVLCALALGLGWSDLVQSHRYAWLTGRRTVAGYVLISAVLVPWLGYVILKPLFGKPHLLIKVTEITFVEEKDTPPPGTPKPGIVFAMSVSNTGSRDAPVIGAVLVPEGKTVSEGDPLTLMPDKPTIRPGDKPWTIEGRVLTDRAQDYRGLRATLILKDGTNREYGSRPIVILPGAFREPLEN